MRHLITLHLMLQALADTTRTTTDSALRRVRHGRDPEAGLSTLEIAVIALGLFLLAGVAAAVLTSATNTRLDKIK